MCQIFHSTLLLNTRNKSYSVLENKNHLISKFCELFRLEIHDEDEFDKIGDIKEKYEFAMASMLYGHPKMSFIETILTEIKTSTFTLLPSNVGDINIIKYAMRNMIWVSKSSLKEYWLNDIYTHNALTIIKETLNPKLRLAIKEVQINSF